MKIDQAQAKAYRVVHPDTSSRVGKATPTGGFGDLLEQMLHQPPPSNTHLTDDVSPEEREKIEAEIKEELKNKLGGVAGLQG